MSKKKRSQKNLKALTVFAFFELVTLGFWEQALGWDAVPGAEGVALNMLTAGTLVSAMISMAFWNHLRRRYRKTRVRHVLADVVPV